MLLIVRTTSIHFLFTSLVHTLLLGLPVSGQLATGDRQGTVVSLLARPLRFPKVEVRQPSGPEWHPEPAMSAHQFRAPPGLAEDEFKCAEMWFRSKKEVPAIPT